MCKKPLTEHQKQFIARWEAVEQRPGMEAQSLQLFTETLTFIASGEPLSTEFVYELLVINRAFARYER